MADSQPLLRTLRANAVFSSLSAVTLLLAAPWIATQLGLTSPVAVFIVAAGLLVFALQLWNIVRSGRIRNREIHTIIGGDIAWLVGSAVFVALFYSRITFTGLLLIDLVALAVLFFAIQQFRGLRRLAR